MTYDIQEVRRQWEGHETPLTWGRYPVEHEPIRRHCHMLDDANPLFLAEGHCPPVMVDYFASQGAWPAGDFDILGLIHRIPTPGDRLINLNQDFEWFERVRVGDRLGARHRIVAIRQRATRLDPLSVWIRTETTIVNQRDQVVARRRNQILVHRTPEQIATAATRP